MQLYSWSTFCKVKKKLFYFSPDIFRRPVLTPLKNIQCGYVLGEGKAKAGAVADQENNKNIIILTISKYSNILYNFFNFSRIFQFSDRRFPIVISKDTDFFCI